MVFPPKPDGIRTNDAILIARRKMDWRAISLVIPGVLLGMIPYAIVMASNGLAGFFSSYATRPVGTLGQFVSNITYFVTCTAPWLLFSVTNGAILTSLRAIIQFIILGGVSVAILILCFRRRVVWSGLNATCCWLILLIWATSAILFSVSEAGSFRGWTVRYALPVYFSIPLLFLLLYLNMPGRRGRLLAPAAALALGILNCPEYPIFNGVRAQEKEQLARQLDLRDFLRKVKREVVMGDYFRVYALNFDTLRQIRAIPVSNDYHNFGDTVRSRCVRLALVENDLDRLRDWMSIAGLTGRVYSIADDLFVSVIDGLVEGSYLRRVGQLRYVALNGSSQKAALSESLGMEATQSRVVCRSCAIDSINGRPASTTTRVGVREGLHIAGWAVDANSGTAPAVVFVELQAPDGKSLFVQAQRSQRPDLAAAYSKPSLVTGGLDAFVGRNRLSPGTYRIRLLQIEGNAVIECDTNRYLEITVNGDHLKHGCYPEVTESRLTTGALGKLRE